MSLEFVDEDEDATYARAPDGSIVRTAKPPKSAPTQHPWEAWSPAKKALMDKTLDEAETVKNYLEAGAMAKKPREGAILAAGLNAIGGLPEEDATTLARYRQFKQVTNNDPNWQGPLNINAGPREPEDTPEMTAQRQQQFMAATPEERGRLWAEARLAAERSLERYFDKLRGKKKTPPQITASLGKVF